MDKKQQIVNLWRTCFGDSEAFISLYFDRVYKDENAMTIEKDGKIVSALQIVPHTMTYLGTEISISITVKMSLLQTNPRRLSINLNMIRQKLMSIYLKTIGLILVTMI